MDHITEVISYLQKAEVMYLASFDGEKPHVRPVGFIMEHQGKLYLSTGIGGNIYRELKTNAYFELAAMHPEFPMHRIRVSGKANFDILPEVIEKYIELNPAMKDVPGICVYEMSEWKAVIYEGMEERREIMAQ